MKKIKMNKIRKKMKMKILFIMKRYMKNGE